MPHALPTPLPVMPHAACPPHPTSRDATWQVNVVLTTYEMINLPAAEGEPHLASEHWRCLVVDEAHRLKNAESKLTRELELFKFDHMLLLSGTPLQVHAISPHLAISRWSVISL